MDDIHKLALLLGQTQQQLMMLTEHVTEHAETINTQQLQIELLKRDIRELRDGKADA